MDQSPHEGQNWAAVWRFPSLISGLGFPFFKESQSLKPETFLRACSVLSSARNLETDLSITQSQQHLTAKRWDVLRWNSLSWFKKPIVEEDGRDSIGRAANT